MSRTSYRNLEIREKIDELELPDHDVQAIFSQLDRINRLTLNNFILKKAFIRLVQNNRPKGVIHIVDLGCGSGSQIYFLSRVCKKMGIDARFTGIDFNEILLKNAREQAGQNPTFNFVRADILSPDFDLPNCDILISSQFIYRFTDGGLVKFLQKNRSAINTGMVLSEISRDGMSRIFFPLFGRLSRLHRTVVSDGLIAINKAWKKAELEQIVILSGQFKQVKVSGFKFRYAVTCY